MHEESEWLAALVIGDSRAFSDLYEKYHRALYLFILKLSKNPHEAEELVQSVFVTVWLSRQFIDISKPFSAYLFSIARNRYYDMLRKRVTESCYADYILQQNNLIADDFEKEIEDKEIYEIINKLLQQIPNRRQKIFRMSREDDLSYKQIAEKLQISENTVDTQIRKALNFLRKELPKYLKMFL
jgi:RNA polymerase sigma-70 factor (ECF subfamily)